MREVKAANGRLEMMVVDVRRSVTRIEATLPYLGTKAEVAGVRVETAEMVNTLPYLGTKAEAAEVKAELIETVKILPYLPTKADVALLRAELADKPGKAYLVSLLALLIIAYAAGLAALAVLK